MQQTITINSRPQDAYRRQNVMTANSLDLIVLLYDALKKNIVLGKKGIIKKDAYSAHTHLMKAQQILTEMVNSLDMNYEISENLLDLYEFFIINIGEANIKKDPEPLEPVIEMVESLRSAWYEISISNKGSLYASEGQA
jgi:flagellar protein FliS